MEIIVISSTEPQNHEVDEVVKMFSAGLKYFHIRKPRMSKSELRDYVLSFPEEYRNRLVLHGFHGLVGPLKLGGMHLSRNHRSRGTGYKLKLWLTRKFQSSLVVTRTFHKLTDITTDKRAYSYAFLSPVFDSITQSTLSAGFSQRALHIIIPQAKQPIYAMGGVTLEKLPIIQRSGFHGAVFHGSIWGASMAPHQIYLKALEIIGTEA